MAPATHLRSLQALALAVRLGSLKAVAEALAITPAAAGQRIKAIEELIGVDLLVRGRSGLQPTPALAPALARLDAAFRQLDEVAELLELQREHEVDIVAPPDFAELWLKPRLEAFGSSHPNIRAHVHSAAAREPGRRAQCTIAFGPLDEGDEPLFGEALAPICSPANEQRIAVRARRDRLEGFPLLHVEACVGDPPPTDWPRWVRAHRLRRTAPERGMRFSSVSAALEATLADAGVALCPIALLLDRIEAGAIRLPFPETAAVAAGPMYRIRFRAGALARPQARRLRAFLLAEAAKTADQLASRLTPSPAAGR